MVSVAELREFVDASQISDAALELLLSGIEAEINSAAGPERDTSSPVTEMKHGGYARIFPAYPMDTAQVITVVESVADVDTTLSADDYRIWHGGRVLVRLNDGTNPRQVWGQRVTLTYVPQSDNARRRFVVIELAKTMLAYSGYEEERIGELQLTPPSDYEAKRNALLRRLSNDGMGAMA